MKLIDSSAEIMDTSIRPLELIERIGRTCYKSDSSFTKDSAFKFFVNLVDRKHFAMLEHATFVFEILGDTHSNMHRFRSCPHIQATCDSFDGHTRVLVSGNMRAIKENNLYMLMQELVREENYPELNYYFEVSYSPHYCAPKRMVKLINPTAKSLTKFEVSKHLYTTFKFICDRGVSHELVRHRLASFAQESTRYCNYSKDKFGKEITCIKPEFYDSIWSAEEKSVYENSLRQSEANYFMLLDSGKSPQQARGVLPTDLKTEVIMTANDAEWNHFFSLRADGVTGTPHPNMQSLARKALLLYNTMFV